MFGSYRDSLVVEILVSGGGGFWILFLVLYLGVIVVCVILVFVG